MAVNKNSYDFTFLNILSFFTQILRIQEFSSSFLHKKSRLLPLQTDCSNLLQNLLLLKTIMQKIMKKNKTLEGDKTKESNMTQRKEQSAWHIEIEKVQIWSQNQQYEKRLISLNPDRWNLKEPEKHQLLSTLSADIYIQSARWVPIQFSTDKTDIKVELNLQKDQNDQQDLQDKAEVQDYPEDINIDIDGLFTWPLENGNSSIQRINHQNQQVVQQLQQLEQPQEPQQPQQLQELQDLQHPQEPQQPQQLQELQDLQHPQEPQQPQELQQPEQVQEARPIYQNRSKNRWKQMLKACTDIIFKRQQRYFEQKIRSLNPDNEQFVNEFRNQLERIEARLGKNWNPTNRDMVKILMHTQYGKSYTYVFDLARKKFMQSRTHYSRVVKVRRYFACMSDFKELLKDPMKFSRKKPLN